MINRIGRFLKRYNFFGLTRSFAPSDTRATMQGQVFARARTGGVPVDPDRALRHAAVWGCVRVISETIASLPWHVHRKLPDGGRADARNHIADRLLSRRPNPEQTPFTFREVLLAHALLYGNGYAEIVRDHQNRPKELWPIPPDRVEIERLENGEVVYIIRGGIGMATALPAANVYHLRGLGYDGLKGYPVVEYAARTIGLSIGAEAYGAAFYGQGTHFGGFLRTPGTLQPEARENLRKSLREMHGGPEHAHRLGLLEDGIEFVPTTIPPDQAQFLDTRKFQVAEIARWFRVPPHKLADLERATFSNIEQQSLDFVAETITPWVVRLEQEADAKLLGENNLFTKVNLTALLRADSNARSNFYKTLSGLGVLSINEIRALEDLNPIGHDGDARLIPMNMTPLARALKEPEPPAPPMIAAEDDPEEPVDPEEEQATAHRDLIIDVLRRQYRRMSRAREDMAADKLPTWLIRHKEYTANALLPTSRAVAEHHGTTVDLESLCDRIAANMIDEGVYSQPDFESLAKGLEDGISNNADAASTARN